MTIDNIKKEDKFDFRFASWLYKLRWPLTLALLLIVAFVFSKGVTYVGELTSSVKKVGDVSMGTGEIPPQMFDPDMRVWFGSSDEAVAAYDAIEDRFVAEDYVMVAFEDKDSEFGVFSRRSLAAVKRLTEKFLTVPGVRHVSSLTYNPWIRWGSIEDENGKEEGLLISDLVEVDPSDLSDEDIILRMVATLGAERSAKKIGEKRVRDVLGADVDFKNYLGEPLLLGTIINENSDVTVLQVQVLRPHLSDEKRDTLFKNSDIKKAIPIIYSIQYQRAALRGIEHYLREEQGLLSKTVEFKTMQKWVLALSEGEEKENWLLSLNDPSKIFMKDQKGQLIRKYIEYNKMPDGTLADMSDPMSPITAPNDYKVTARSPYQFRLGGVPIFERNFEETGMADGLYVPLMFLVLMLALFIMFRNLLGVFVPILVVFISVMAMIGTSFANGNMLNNLTMISPNMLTAVAIADAIHLVASWFMLRPNYSDKSKLMVEVIRKNALPVFLTSVTTAIGFYTLTLSEITPVKLLGMTAGMGTLAAYVLTMAMVPALLSLVPHRQDKVKVTSISKVFNEQRSSWYSALVMRLRKPIAVLAIALIVISFYGLKNIHLDTDFRSMFPESNKTMSHFNWIETKLGGVGDLEIVFDGINEDDASLKLSAAEEDRLATLKLKKAVFVNKVEEGTTFNKEDVKELVLLDAKDDIYQLSRIGVNAKFLKDLNHFEIRLREEMAIKGSALSIVTDIVSPLDILRKMHQVQHENNSSFYRVPQESDVPESFRKETLEFDEFTEEWSLTPKQEVANLVAQYYLQYENGARPGENLSNQLSSNRQHFRMQARIEQAPSLVQLEAFDQIRNIAENEFPELGKRLKISGKSLLFARTSRMFDVGFTKSLGVALLLITLIIGLIFKSPRLAMISVVSNVLPIMLPLSFFGILGIPLDGPAILISSVALGVCVDDTIHFFTKYVEAKKQGKTDEQSIAYVIHQTGAAITITSVVLVIGFMTMLLSDFAPNLMMGVLATVMIAIAWFSDFTITPALLALTSGEKKA
jgi:predicted RND superfamily exporter protein